MFRAEIRPLQGGGYALDRGDRRGGLLQDAEQLSVIDSPVDHEDDAKLNCPRAICQEICRHDCGHFAGRADRHFDSSVGA